MDDEDCNQHFITMQPDKYLQELDPDLTLFGIALISHHNETKTDAEIDITRLVVSDYTYTKNSDDLVLEPSCTIGNTTKMINLQPWIVNPDILSHVGTHCTDIKLLNVAYSQHFNTKSLIGFITNHKINLFGKASKLKHVDLSGWRVSNKSDIDAGIASLVACCGNSLSSLELRDTDISDKGLTILALRCSSLVYLDISNCQNITDQGISSVLLANSRKEANPESSRNTIETLKTRNCYLLRGRWYLTPGPTANTVALSLGYLTHLNISGCASVDNTAVIEIVASARASLLALDISNLTQISNQSIHAIAECCAGLQSLYCQGCRYVTDDGMISLATGVITRLESIDVSLTQVTDVGLASLFEAFSNTLKLVHCKAPFGVKTKLSTLKNKVAYSTAEQHAAISMKFLKQGQKSRMGKWISAMADDRQSPLESIVLSGHTLFSPKNLMALLDKAATLCELDLSNCERIDDLCVEFIAKSSVPLSVLLLDGCFNLTDGALLTISDSLTDLRELDISFPCPEKANQGIFDRITDEAVCRILQNLPQLSKFYCRYRKFIMLNSISSNNNQKDLFSLAEMDLEGCVKLNPACISLMLQVFTFLNSIRVSRCPLILNQDLQQIVSENSNLPLKVVLTPYVGIEYSSDLIKRRTRKNVYQRFAEEDTAVNRIQRRFRYFISAPNTLAYMLLAAKDASLLKAIRIQKLWRSHHNKRCVREFQRALAATKSIQRMTRCHFWRKAIFCVLDNVEAKNAREILARQMHVDHHMSKRIQKWYSGILWQRSSDGIFHAQLKSAAENELAWRKRTRNWKGVFSSICEHAALNARGQVRFAAATFCLDVKRNQHIDEASSSGILTTCSLCKTRRARMWCALCHDVLCKACAWSSSIHNSHLIKSVDPVLPPDMIQELEFPIQYYYIGKDNPLFDLQIVLLQANWILGDAKMAVHAVEQTLATRTRVIAELLKYHARKKEAGDKARIILERMQRSRMNEAAVLIQRMYRNKPEPMEENKSDTGFSFDRAIRIQCWFRGLESRRVWHILKKSGFSPSSSIEEKRELLCKEFTPIFRNCMKIKAKIMMPYIKVQWENYQHIQENFQTSVVETSVTTIKEILTKTEKEHQLLKDEYQRLSNSASADQNTYTKICRAQKDLQATHKERLFRILNVFDTQIDFSSRIGMLGALKAAAAAKMKTYRNEIQKLERLEKIFRRRRDDLTQNQSPRLNFLCSMYARSSSQDIRSLVDLKCESHLEILWGCELEWLNLYLDKEPNYTPTAKIQDSIRVTCKPLLDRVADHWQHMHQITVFENKRLHGVLQYEKDRQKEIRKLLHLDKALTSYLNELCSLQIQQIRAIAEEDSIQFLELEQATRERIMSHQRQIEKQSRMIIGISRSFDRNLECFTRPVVGKMQSFSGILPPSLRNPVSSSGLKLEFKRQVWTTLLPAEVLKSINTMNIQQKMDFHIHSALNIRHARLASEAALEEAFEEEVTTDKDAKQKIKQKIESKKGKIPAEIFAESEQTNRVVFGDVREKLSSWWNRNKIEEARMEMSILKRQKATTNIFEAIAADIQFTVGALELQEMENIQQEKKRERHPYLQQYYKNLGRDDPIHIWLRTSINAEEFISDFQISHANEKHDFHMRKNGFKVVNHSKMTGIGRAPGIEFLLGNFTASSKRCLDGIRVTYDPMEEQECATLGYEKVKMDLTKVNLSAGMKLWAHWSKPPDKNGEPCSKQTHRLDTGSLTKKREGYLKLIEESGPDSRLQMLADQIQVQINEAEMQKHVEQSDVLADAVEFLALSKSDVKRLMVGFAAMDTDGSAEISIDELCSAIALPVNQFTKTLFRFLDTSDDGLLDFGEFIHSLGTLCLFGAQEITKMCYSFMEANDLGLVTGPHLRQLLKSMHDSELEDKPLLIVAVQFCEKNADGKGMFGLDTVMDMQKRYPLVLFPAIKIRDTLRAKFLGTRWWERKMQKFAIVREKIKKRREEEQGVSKVPPKMSESIREDQSESSSEEELNSEESIIVDFSKSKLINNKIAT